MGGGARRTAARNVYGPDAYNSGARRGFEHCSDLASSASRILKPGTGQERVLLAGGFFGCSIWALVNRPHSHAIQDHLQRPLVQQNY